MERRRSIGKTFMSAGLVLACGLVACSSEKEGPESFPRDFDSVTEATSAVPTEIRTDFDALLACEGDLSVARGEGVPELTVDRVADIVDAIRADSLAVEKCIEKRQS